MNKTLKLSFSLKNTYRVNSILYSMKQLPFVKNVRFQKLYQSRALKVFANVLAMICEVLSAFLGKAVYLFIMVYGASAQYENTDQSGLFLHILFFLTIIGAFTNTYMFNPGRDKYYAMILMRMDAKQYTLVNYAYQMIKVVAGFFASAVAFGLLAGIALWQCAVIAFFVAGSKLTAAAINLYRFEKTGNAQNEGRLSKFNWIAMLTLLAAAYGLPAIGIIVPANACIALMLATVGSGAAAMLKIAAFSRYKEMYQQILTGAILQIDDAKKLSKQMSNHLISTDAKISSDKRGFEFLNELFVKRHQKILWKSSKKITAFCLFIVLGSLLALYLIPDIKEKLNYMLMNFLPYFVLIMYAVNRGMGFTKALFMNCDHSLLAYSFYKRPKFIVELFKIRLREIIKVNLLPASVIGLGLLALLYFTGGTENPLDYFVIAASIICLSVFFSVHYLTIYYLLQPYNAATDVKSATYQIVLCATYLVCVLVMNIKI